MLLTIGLAAPFVAAQQPPGQIRPRPAEGRQPELQPPTITEYKPKSKLVAPQHPVPRAKFPVIDIHSHQPTPISPAEFDRVMKGDGGEQPADPGQLERNVRRSAAPGRRRDSRQPVQGPDGAVRQRELRNVGPGFGAKAAKQLEADIKAGAVGLKIFKDLGMFDRKADGSRLQVDDPELDPIWETCARLNVPVLIHVAEPPAFFEPLDYNNERWLELALVSPIAATRTACASSS